MSFGPLHVASVLANEAFKPLSEVSAFVSSLLAKRPQFTSFSDSKTLSAHLKSCQDLLRGQYPEVSSLIDSDDFKKLTTKKEKIEFLNASLLTLPQPPKLITDSQLLVEETLTSENKIPESSSSVSNPEANGIFPVKGLNNQNFFKRALSATASITDSTHEPLTYSSSAISGRSSSATSDPSSLSVSSNTTTSWSMS